MRREYTKEEIKIIKKEYAKRNGKKIENILKKLSIKLNRSRSSIRNKAYELGITNREKYYTNEQIQFLKENIDNYSYRDIGFIIGKNESNVYRKCKELGLKKKKVVISELCPHKKRIYTEEDRQRISDFWKKWYKENEHPKGMLGKHHTKETKLQLSESSYNAWNKLSENEQKERLKRIMNTRIKNGNLNVITNKTHTRAKGGKRKDVNNQYFRSSWEANIARYFNFIKEKWEYEPKTFYFENIKRGVRSYTPDFYLPKQNKWIEVKGWMDDKSKVKLKRFKKYYPEEKIEIIGELEYKEIERKLGCFIPNWEWGKTRINPSICMKNPICKTCKFETRCK